MYCSHRIGYKFAKLIEQGILVNFLPFQLFETEFSSNAEDLSSNAEDTFQTID